MSRSLKESYSLGYAQMSSLNVSIKHLQKSQDESSRSPKESYSLGCAEMSRLNVLIKRLQKSLEELSLHIIKRDNNNFFVGHNLPY